MSNNLTPLKRCEILRIRQYPQARDLLAQQAEAIGSNPIQSGFESLGGHKVPHTKRFPVKPVGGGGNNLPVTRLAANDSSGHDGTTLHLEG